MNSKDQSGKRPRIRKTEERSFEKPDNSRFSKPQRKEEGDNRKPERRPYKSTESKDQRPGYNRNRDERPDAGRSYPKPKFNKDRRSSDAENDSYRDSPARSGQRDNDRPKYTGRNTSEGRYGKEQYGRKPYSRKASSPKGFEREDNGLIRLNKYLADSGVCSRREADKLIEAGAVTVNGKVVTQLGTKVSRDDKVAYGGQTLKREVLRYVLLNKPKGFLTTADDPMDRKTVMDLVANACDERIYPVGRLDRNTLGLLLLTNDGELAKKLTHPKYGVKKLYHVTLDKALTKNDLIKISDGIELEDGPIKADAIAWVTGVESKKEVGIELHSGRNRIVRRIFESLGYKVEKLDRVRFASLTKLNLPRGHWRHLTEKEVAMLKMLK